MAAGDEYTFLHVIKPEIDLDPALDPHDESVYAMGAANLRSAIENGRLVRDEKPAYYVYRLSVGDHTQTGIVGAAAVDDYLNDRIKKHEHTRPAKERDRIRLVEALSAHPGPVFLIHRENEQLEAIVEAIAGGPPDVSFSAENVEHTLWTVDDKATCRNIEDRFDGMSHSYIADGHHRAAAAARAFADRREASKGSSYSHFLTVHFPSEQVQVLDYNRIVKDLNAHTPESLIDHVVTAGFDVTVDPPAKQPPSRGSFGMYVNGRWQLLTAREEIVPRDLLGRLDVSILSDRLLGPVLGIGDPRTDPRIDFVGGSRGMKELEKRVDSGAWAVAFSLFPTSLDDVMEVADSGKVMPPKSTWFEPKLRSGMVVQLLDDDGL
jgi:uncharacterized protein (DUF1015 family)